MAIDNFIPIAVGTLETMELDGSEKIAGANSN
jgi:hypothetical protein